MNPKMSALAVLVVVGIGFAVPQLNKTYWNSNWNAMYFEVDGNRVSSEYIYDQGVISATLTGDTLRGFWRENNNEKTCGPGGQWSGRVALLFDSAGKAFTGDWAYCSDSTSVLNLEGSRWVGTWRDSAYTESECLAASRNWCGKVCQIALCGESVTEPKCLDAGRFWCNGTCPLQGCSPTAIHRSARNFPGARSLDAKSLSIFNVQGRSMEPSALHPQGFFLQGR